MPSQEETIREGPQLGRLHVSEVRSYPAGLEPDKYRKCFAFSGVRLRVNLVPREAAAW